MVDNCNHADIPTKVEIIHKGMHVKEVEEAEYEFGGWNHWRTSKISPEEQY
jgi:hypothetical protein